MPHVAFTRRGVLSLALAASFTTGAFALPFTVPVNQSQSSLTFDLCVAGRCDTETSPVTGWAIIELDSVDIPTQITLYDFYFHLTNNLNWNLSWSILGALTASATNVTVLDATPGTAQGPAPIAATQYTFTGVPSNATGTLTYHATGVPCYALQGSGKLCDDTLNLADQGTQTGDMTGTVTTASRTVYLVTNVDRTSPLDPNNPSLGSMHVYGTVRGQAYVPRPIGDVDGDGDVDNLDFTYFALAMAGPGATTPPPGSSAYHFAGSDLDADGDVDLADFAQFALHFGT
jgi:hypothetical protein